MTRLIFLIKHYQLSKLCKAFVNNSSANIKVSKTKQSKISQGFLARLFEPLLKTDLSVMNNVLK